MAATNPIKLAIDRQNQVIVAQLGFAGALPNLFQGDVRDLIVQVVDPGATPGSYTTVNLNGYTLRSTIGATPKGDGSQQQYTGPTALAWDPVNNWFAGSVDLTDARLYTAIAAASSLPSTWEFGLRAAGITQVLYQSTMTIFAVEDLAGAGASPANPNLFLTTAESDARYLRIAPVNGKICYFNSPDGNTTIALQANNDGTLKEIPIAPALPGQ